MDKPLLVFIKYGLSNEVEESKKKKKKKKEELRSNVVLNRFHALLSSMSTGCIKQGRTSQLPCRTPLPLWSATREVRAHVALWTSFFTFERSSASNNG